MSIQKKSLISALKTTKKANVASTEVAKGENRTSMKVAAHKVTSSKAFKQDLRAMKMVANKTLMGKAVVRLKKV